MIISKDKERSCNKTIFYTPVIWMALTPYRYYYNNITDPLEQVVNMQGYAKKSINK